MTIPLRIAATNLIDAGTVAASSEVSTLTAVKLQTLDIRDVWQASSTTAYVLADLLSSKTIGITALINCSLDADDTIRVRVFDSGRDRSRRRRLRQRRDRRSG